MKITARFSAKRAEKVGGDNEGEKKRRRHAAPLISNLENTLFIDCTVHALRPDVCKRQVGGGVYSLY